MDYAVVQAGHGQLQVPPLVGRANERQFLRDRFAAAVQGHGHLVLVGGEAGIGKTTLVRDLSGEAVATGALVLSGHCYDLSSTPPYGPWLDLAARYSPIGDLPVLPPALVGDGIEEIKSQAALFAQAREFFIDVAGVQPALVVLEDLHWSDPASLELLSYLSAHIRSHRLLLVVTYRIDEPEPTQLFSRQLPALMRDAEGLRVDLRRLDVEDLRTLVAARWRLPQADEDCLVDYLKRHAEGIPLYANELLRTLEEEGHLRRDGDRWALDEIESVRLPPYLRQVIDGRVARLGEEMREPLAMAAVIGQEVPLDLWARVAGLDEETLLAIIERAVEAHLLEAEGFGTQVRFVHALTRAALYEGVLAPRRRIWHRLVGEVIAEADAPDPDAVAYHFQQAGDIRAWEWLERAGERAQRAYAWLTATERFAAAAALLQGVTGQERTRGWLLYRCGRLRRYSHPALGIDDLKEAERLAHLVEDRTLAADARYSRGVLRCFAGDFRLGLVDLSAGVTALEALPIDESHPSDTTAAWFADSLPSKARASTSEFDAGAIYLSTHGVNHRRGTLPWFLAATGHVADAAMVAEAFLDLAGRVPHAGELVLSARGHSHQGLGIVHATLGRPDEGQAAFADARHAYAALDHHAVIAFALLSELQDIVLPYRAADGAERRRLAEEAEGALQRAGDALPGGVSPRLAWLSVLFLEGRWQEASDIAADTPSRAGYPLRRQAAVVLAQLGRHRDEPELAWAQIRSLLPRGAATDPGECVFVDALLCQRLAAELELDRGDLTAALAWLTANDRWLRWNGSVRGRSENSAVWARYHRLAGDVERARTCADEALRAASQPDQPLARLTAHRLSGELAGGDRQDDAEKHFTAALALADACAAPYERAMTLLALAELRTVERRVAEAASLLAELRTICDLLDARLALKLADALETGLNAPPAAPAPAPTLPAGLTQREVEVLSLVAQGLTDAEVAGRLSISGRTVGQHLRSIYSKLAVSSRVGATRFAIEHDLA
jgi:DNA-binding CsgD family transcriptional regulator